MGETGSILKRFTSVLFLFCYIGSLIASVSALVILKLNQNHLIAISSWDLGEDRHLFPVNDTHGQMLSISMDDPRAKAILGSRKMARNERIFFEATNRNIGKEISRKEGEHRFFVLTLLTQVSNPFPMLAAMGVLGFALGGWVRLNRTWCCPDGSMHFDSSYCVWYEPKNILGQNLCCPQGSTYQQSWAFRSIPCPTPPGGPGNPG